MSLRRRWHSRRGGGIAVFEYQGYHFEPVGKVRGDFFSITRNCDSPSLSKNDEWQNDDPPFRVCDTWSHEGFYLAAQSEDDIFLCKEDRRVYIPGENYLFRYRGGKAVAIEKEAEEMARWEHLE
jgi:hypothetical protein